MWWLRCNVEISERQVRLQPNSNARINCIFSRNLRLTVDADHYFNYTFLMRGVSSAAALAVVDYNYSLQPPTMQILVGTVGRVEFRHGVGSRMLSNQEGGWVITHPP